MNTHSDTHLTHDQHLMALVDPTDMDADLQAHLQSCSQCQHQAQQLSRRFERMGQMARQLASEPSRPFRLPAQGGRKRVGWQFKSAMAMGLAGALVLVFTVWWPQRFNPTQPTPQQLAQQEKADALLMAEIDDLVNDALPKAYQELAMANDTGLSDLSEDLIDWIVPIIEEDDDPVDPRA